MSDAAEAARLLLEARKAQRQLAGLPETCRPRDLAMAYRIQAQHVAGLRAVYDARPIGYKIGCTNTTAQALLGLDAPFSGVLLDRFRAASPARLSGDANFMRCIEAEFAFRIGRDLAPRGTAYTRDDVAAAVAAVLPAIEVVDTRFEEWTKVGALSLIADQGSTGHWVSGAERTDWRDFDLPGHPVRLTVNDAPTRSGIGGNVLGDPLNALTWLANDLVRRGEGLRAGELVSTGTSIDVYFAEPGDRIRADFGALGAVELDFV